MGECFVYGVIMSTFHEYFIEAFPEPPSIQDLVVTPVGGALIGEVTYQLQELIRRNDGKIFASPFIGRAAMFLLNPLNDIINGFEDVVGPIVKKHAIKIQIGYGNREFSENRLQDGHREMSVMIQGKF